MVIHYITSKNPISKRCFGKRERERETDSRKNEGGSLSGASLYVFMFVEHMFECPGPAND